MARLFWVAMVFIGGGLAYLLITGGDNAPFDVTGDQLAETLYLGVLGLVIAAGILSTGIGLGRILRSLLVWAAIFLVFVAGFQYRYELQDVASRLTAGFIPGSPLDVTNADGRIAVALEKIGGGHFIARAQVNGAPITMLVDTGATTTVLTIEDALAAGIDTDRLSFGVPISTANGQASAAHAVAREIRVGKISRSNVPVLVAGKSKLDQSLLGMNFINSLSGFDMRGDRLTLID